MIPQLSYGNLNSQEKGDSKIIDGALATNPRLLVLRDNALDG